MESAREILLSAEACPSGEPTPQTANKTWSSFASGGTYDDEGWKSTKLSEVRCGQKIWRHTWLEACRIRSLHLRIFSCACALY